MGIMANESMLQMKSFHFTREKGEQGKGGGGGGLQFKGKGMMPFWPSHSCVSLVETRCHHLVSSPPCRDHRRLPHRLPPAPGPGRAGTLPTDRKGSCHYTTHWEYTANRQKGFLPCWDSANRQKGFLSQHTGNTLPTDRKGSRHYTTHSEYTANRQKGFLPCWDSANRQKGFRSLHNTLGIHSLPTDRKGSCHAGTLPTDRKGFGHYTTHWEYTHCQQTERVPATLGLCQQTERVPITTQREYSANRQKGFPSLHNTLGIYCQLTERVPVTTQHTGNTLPTDRKGSHHTGTLPTDWMGSRHYTTLAIHISEG